MLESKVIILIISDFSFFPLIDLCSAHLSVVHGITFFDRGRMADGQQMGVLPCLLVQILAPAEGCQGLSVCPLTACETSPVFGILTKGSELMQRAGPDYWPF